MTDHNPVYDSTAGNFATSRRGGIDSHELAFIRARSFEGRTARQIAKMIGRSLEDVLPYVQALAPEIEAPTVVDLDPPPEPTSERVPQPGETVLSLWRGLLVVPHRKATRLEIAQEVANRYGVPLEAIRGPSRMNAYVVPRQEAMWRMVRARRWSTPQIGDWFGGRDHTTVLHACKRHEERMKAAGLAEAA